LGLNSVTKVPASMKQELGVFAPLFNDWRIHHQVELNENIQILSFPLKTQTENHDFSKLLFAVGKEYSIIKFPNFLDSLY